MQDLNLNTDTNGCSKIGSEQTNLYIREWADRTVADIQMSWDLPAGTVFLPLVAGDNGLDLEIEVDVGDIAKTFFNIDGFSDDAMFHIRDVVAESFVRRGISVCLTKDDWNIVLESTADCRG